MFCPICAATSAGYILASSGGIIAGYVAVKTIYHTHQKKIKMEKAIRLAKPSKITVVKPVKTIDDLKARRPRQ
jgi:hypothetical protein